MIDDFWKRIEIMLVLRGKKNLKRFCEEAGIQYQTIINQKYLHKYPSIPVLIAFSKNLDCSIDWLLRGDGKNPLVD